MSGQGPYFGQLGWFLYWHPERVQSAIDRYTTEIKRVTGVIDTHLTKAGTPYLVGEKVTYADIMMVPYYIMASHFWSDMIDLSQWPAYYSWMERLLKRPAIARVTAEMEKYIIKGLQARVEALAAKKE